MNIHDVVFESYNNTRQTHLSILLFVTEQLVHTTLDTIEKDELLKYIIQTRRWNSLKQGTDIPFELWKK